MKICQVTARPVAVDPPAPPHTAAVRNGDKAAVCIGETAVKEIIYIMILCNRENPSLGLENKRYWGRDVTTELYLQMPYSLFINYHIDIDLPVRT